MSPVEIARIRPLKSMKRVEGPLKVNGPMYGGMTAVALMFKGREFIVLANDLDDVEALWRALGSGGERIPYKAKKVALALSKDVKRI